jgi:hypothetical protein
LEKGIVEGRKRKGDFFLWFKESDAEDDEAETED